jgi:hypothetical protein
MPIPRRNLHLNFHINLAKLAAAKSAGLQGTKATVLLPLHAQKAEFTQSLFVTLLPTNFYCH